jgi:hypothetical protein
MATWIKLLDYETDQRFFVINTHWSLDSEARFQSGLLMRDKILELSGGLPIIATGDFNETTAGRGYGALVRKRTATEFELGNSYFQSGGAAGKTFHGYNGGIAGNPIDFVLHSSGSFTALSGSIVRTTFGGYYPSDHYPVEVILDIHVPSLTGDYDGNGSVGVEDYSQWQATYGSDSVLIADGNGDGIVDAADYVIWRHHLAAGGAASGHFAVPEPLTAPLVAVAMAWALTRRVRFLLI